MDALEINGDSIDSEMESIANNIEKALTGLSSKQKK